MQTHFQECDLGYTFKTNEVFGFFGNVRATLPEIEKAFPEFKFSRIKQTHSDIIVPASSELTAADAHWTIEKNKALLISTADCTPVVVFERSSKKAAIIHAGWRGVENQITLKTLQSLANGVSKPNFEIWIGPHILQKSFEVQADVLKQLLASSYLKDTSGQFIKTETGFFVNLKSIIESQINSEPTWISEIKFLDIDTKTDLRFHSYRRDKADSGRNLSFIAKI